MIAAEPRLVRPIAEGRDDLNAALTERFFVLQDALRLRAKDLAVAAEKKSDDEAGPSAPCASHVVTCHSYDLPSANVLAG